MGGPDGAPYAPVCAMYLDRLLMCPCLHATKEEETKDTLILTAKLGHKKSSPLNTGV